MASGTARKSTKKSGGRDTPPTPPLNERLRNITLQAKKTRKNRAVRPSDASACPNSTVDEMRPAKSRTGIMFSWSTTSALLPRDELRSPPGSSFSIKEEPGLQEITVRREDKPDVHGILKRTSVTQVTRVVESSHNIRPGSRSPYRQDSLVPYFTGGSATPSVGGKEQDNIKYKRVTAVRKTSKTHQDQQVNVEERAVVEFIEDIVPFGKSHGGGLAEADADSAPDSRSSPGVCKSPEPDSKGRV